MGYDTESADKVFELLGRIELFVELWVIYVCSSSNVIENGTFPSFLNSISYLSPMSTLLGNCELSVDSCIHDNV